MRRILLVTLWFLWAAAAFAEDEALAPPALEFFEKKIRPVLAEHCYQCHSGQAKKVKGGLLLDSRAGLAAGGESGPAFVPGHPEKSKIIEAIRYQNVDLRMPPRSKLSDAVIADLSTWIERGAPWPDEKSHKIAGGTNFDLLQRKNAHWSWQKIGTPAVPKVRDTGWAKCDIDRFVLVKLEEKGLKPSGPADARTLLRRMYFDIIGLPPGRDEVEEFARAWDAPQPERQAAVAKVVDQLLASPRFGERWGRHWLDLVRYAESRGHEFDYTIPNAYQYRDYVIRALNADVPYDQFVREHIAGDLLTNPRLHAKEGYDESILGTGFWFFGEEGHSPVDVRQDQADRFDNRLDVMTKAFLGLTVSCARCHDHKFDAISAKDYYALFGFLESSNYRLARFDTLSHNRKIGEQLWALRRGGGKEILASILQASGPTRRLVDQYLLTAGGIEDHSARLNPELLQRWKLSLAQALKDRSDILHPFAIAASTRQRSVQEIVRPVVEGWMAKRPQEWPAADVVVDYRQGSANRLLADDVSFGLAPLKPGDIALGETPERPITSVMEEGAVEKDRVWDGYRIAAGNQEEPGGLGGKGRAGRTLRTPEFTIRQGNVYALVRGTGSLYAAVAQHVMIAGPLHGRLVQPFNTKDKWQWVAIDLTRYPGKIAHLEFTPKDKTDFALRVVVQAASAPAPYADTPYSLLASKLKKASSLQEMAKAYQDILDFPVSPADETNAPYLNWLVRNTDRFFSAKDANAANVAKAAGPIFEERKKLLGQIKLESRLALAMQDGSGTDERVFLRGNPGLAGPPAPRRFLEALAGSEPLKVKEGSGRLELARQMTDPAVTPFITRVYVNRVWHHLFGRGIVGSVDNFGVLGEAPTHPELLDYLADKFAQEGWSLKKLIRAIVLTQTYQMSSHPDAKADEIDAQDLLLHRMRLRRLEGEAIRDAILRVSGRLNLAMHGPSVPVHLTPFQDGRGRPASGPLDGDGRRSIYLSVRRNFLSPFLLAFDTPTPFSTVGRRTVSNVPAQALILMNDPFVHQQAEVWAKRVLGEKGSDADRVRGMYLDAFGRPPTEVELQACLIYVRSGLDQRGWTDLAHVLFNTKEFFFLN